MEDRRYRMKRIAKILVKIVKRSRTRAKEKNPGWRQKV